MPEVRDPGLKLFGKTIPLLESQEEAVEEIGFRAAGFSVEEKKSSAIETSSSEEGAMEFERRDEPDESSEMDASSTVCCENDEEGAVAMEGTKSEQGKRKTLPKPDKILPCPRCNSSNTKFCYYNNYNVNQPRHFCKNCQRYWTAGGTMRNVPVGAGRRKNKHAALHRRPAKAAGCGEVIDNAVEPSCASSTLTASHGVLSEATDNAAGEENTAGIPPPPFHCYPWSMAAAAPPPPFCGAAVPFPLLPAFFWSSCMAGWQNSATWVGSDAAGGPMPAPEKTKGSLWVPKTLRIGDPDEAAKSSIWATLGIKPDLKTCNGGIFRGFDHKPVVDRVAMEGVPVNHVNPAALSRSQAFKEST